METRQKLKMLQDQAEALHARALRLQAKVQGPEGIHLVEQLRARAAAQAAAQAATRQAIQDALAPRTPSARIGRGG